VPFSGGRPSGKAEDVVTGFLNSDEKARGRAVGLAVDKSGALLIADDIGEFGLACDTRWAIECAADPEGSSIEPQALRLDWPGVRDWRNGAGAASRPPALLADVLARLRRGLRRRRQHHRIFENDDLVRAFGIDNLEAG
jgi:hypothetical protein